MTTPGPDFEPQEEEVKGGVSEQISDHQENYNKKIKELREKMPTDFVTGAQEFIHRFKEFRNGVDQDLDLISE